MEYMTTMEYISKMCLNISEQYYYALVLFLWFSFLSYDYYYSQPFLKTNTEISAEVVKPKYEDKYLKEYRDLVDDSTVFSKEELENETMYGIEYKQKIEQTIQNDIQNLKDEIKLNKEKYFLLSGKNYDETSSDKIEDECDDYDELIETIDFLQHYSKQLYELEKNMTVADEVVFEVSRKNTMTVRRKNLVNNYVMEKTPLGNVVMRYNPDREAFEYFSDNTIPYRFLEVIGRKYVIMFNCKSIFIDMEDELKKYEAKLQEKDAEEEQKEKEKEKEKNPEKDSVKKNIFAKFKTYNKGTSSGPSAAPPKNNNMPIPKGLAKIMDQYSPKEQGPEKERVLLKDRANRYSCEGRFSGFNILKKVKKEVVDNRANLKFSDFKRLKKEQ